MQSQEPARWKPTREDVERKAWKYLGYQSFANFVASDHDFFVLRRFGALSARVLLGLQDELSCLEGQLDVVESRLRQRDGPQVHNGTFRHETQEERKQLVSHAYHLLSDYSGFFSVEFTSLSHLPGPESRSEDQREWRMTSDVCSARYRGCTCQSTELTPQGNIRQSCTTALTNPSPSTSPQEGCLQCPELVLQQSARHR